MINLHELHPRYSLRLTGGVWSVRAMLELDANAFVNAVRYLEFARRGFPKTDGGNDAVISLIKHLRIFATHCETLDLPCAAGMARKLIQQVKPKRIGNEVVKGTIANIQETFEIEIDQRKIFAIHGHLSEYYDGVRHSFGEVVIERFPDARFDIEEAGKCLALSRHDACVFHLMRALEFGVVAVHKCLGCATSKNPSWGQYLSEIRARIEENNRLGRWGSAADKEAFAQYMAGILAVCKDGHRNVTMHIGRRYTEDEAREAFQIVKATMQKIASRCDQDGLPLLVT